MEEAQIRVNNDRWIVKYLCCCLKTKLGDEDDDDDNIKETRYSSGDSNASDVEFDEREPVDWKE